MVSSTGDSDSKNKGKSGRGRHLIPNWLQVHTHTGMHIAPPHIQQTERQTNRYTHIHTDKQRKKVTFFF